MYRKPTHTDKYLSTPNHCYIKSTTVEGKTFKLMFMGIVEGNVMDGQGTQQEPENTKEIIYKFMEEEMQISNHTTASNFKEFIEWVSLSTMAHVQ